MGSQNRYNSALLHLRGWNRLPTDLEVDQDSGEALQHQESSIGGPFPPRCDLFQGNVGRLESLFDDKVVYSESLIIN